MSIPLKPSIKERIVDHHAYQRFLKDKIFKISKFGQFELLFDFLEELNSDDLGQVAIIERSYIYQGRSIFASLLNNLDVSVIDYRPISASERSGLQSSWLDELEHNFQMSEGYILDNGKNYEIIETEKNFKTLVIPNVLHHCRDFALLIKKFVEMCPSINKICIFDSYIREQHQYPDDFCRYTVAALENCLKNFNFKKINSKEYGNVFDGILYLIAQSEQILQDYSELEGIKEKCLELTPILKKVASDEKYRNLGRPYASYSSSYSVVFERGDI